MLDACRIWPHIRARLETGPLGPYLDGFVAALHQQGYSPRGIRRHLHAADRFGEWLRRHGIAATAVDEATVARYTAGLGRYPSRARPRGQLPELAFGVHGLGAWLWEQAIAPRHLGVAADTAADRWLRTFDNHLDHVAGLAVGTRRAYLCYARAFLQARFGARAPARARPSADDLTEFVRVQAARLRPSASRLPVTALRAMVRSLATTGAVRAGLAHAVPTVRQWKQAGVPAYLSPSEVARVLAGCARSTPVGRRDRAILFVLVRLGLRAGEIPALRLDDINWRRGCLRVRAGKSRRERVLPLRSFVTCLATAGGAGSLRAHQALDWACATGCGPVGQARRLSVARAFLAYLHAADPTVEVPGSGLLARAVRPQPHIFSVAEITALLHAARALGPRGSLRQREDPATPPA